MAAFRDLPPPAPRHSVARADWCPKPSTHQSHSETRSVGARVCLERLSTEPPHRCACVARGRGSRWPCGSCRSHECGPQDCPVDPVTAPHQAEKALNFRRDVLSQPLNVITKPKLRPDKPVVTCLPVLRACRGSLRGLRTRVCVSPRAFREERLHLALGSPVWDPTLTVFSPVAGDPDATPVCEVNVGRCAVFGPDVGLLPSPDWRSLGSSVRLAEEFLAAALALAAGMPAPRHVL
ncbi:hypothetical protein Efla_006975 [Eimeria flavescens]